MSEKVKLKILEYGPDVTVIDTHEAKTWDNFMLVRLKVYSMEEFENVANHLNETLPEQYPDKKFVFLPDHIDVALYGVVPENES